jgi:glucosylceramidase
VRVAYFPTALTFCYFLVRQKVNELNLSSKPLNGFEYFYPMTIKITILATLLIYSRHLTAQYIPEKWVCTTHDQPFTEIGFPLVDFPEKPADVSIISTDTLQAVHGFGACFNELGWKALLRLNEADRQLILREFFQPGLGGNFNICRLPVGANDFSTDWYAYNETPGDYQNKTFSIKHDEQYLLPFVKQALQYNPAIRLWASPWSPPSWMKHNAHYACASVSDKLDIRFHNGLKPHQRGREGSDMFISDHKTMQAYADYFSRYIQAYRQQGIRIAMVMPQNEFNSCQIFPSCTFTASTLARFTGKYLGPAMQKLGVEVYFGTMERPSLLLADTVLQDPLARQYIRGAGFQWAGKDCMAKVHEQYPELTLYQTEQECGNGKNDWAYCRYAFTLMHHYFSRGANAYLYWNIALDEGGTSRWGWQQNSLVTVDTLANTYRLNHEYYLLKHLSHFVQAGARRLQTNGTSGNLLAFRNRDGRVVILVQNDQAESKTWYLNLNGTKQVFLLPPDSFNTFVFND